MTLTLEQRMAMIENRQRQITVNHQIGRTLLFAMIRLLERLTPGATDQLMDIAESMRQLAESENRLSDVGAIDTLVYQLDQELRTPAND